MAGGPDYRHHWHEPAFWRWYWRERVPFGGKVLVALAAIALLAGGGYAAESALPAQAASSGKSSKVLTIVRTYTVFADAPAKERVKERIVVRRVTTPGRRVTQTVSGPARPVTVVHNVPQTHVVTVNGRTHTTIVVRRTTAPGKTTTAPAQTQTVTTTVPTTVVETTTVTVGKKSAAPPPPKTVTVTTTVPAVTITVPGTGP